MSLGRVIRLFVVLTPAILLVTSAIWFVSRSATPAKHDVDTTSEVGTGTGKLVVVVAFDQMRGDYLSRWASEFGPGGFERMKTEGIWYSNAHLPYACSSTAPGHASIATGAQPSVHGIIENRWYDRGKGKVVYAASSEETYDRVPPSEGVAKKWPGIAPTRLLAPTVGDSLREATNGKGRTISLSMKDRSAVLMGGKEPVGCYCFDSSEGEFHTSSFYRSRLPDWVDRFNRDAVYRWAGRSWDRLKPLEIYDRLAGPDNMNGEAKNPGGLPSIFPHALPKADDKTANYLTAIEASPFGNELLWEFAKTAIDSEKLGDRGASDLLLVSFSPNDIVGHAYGPDSHEVMDITLRSDAIIAEMIAHLERTLGKDRFVLIVTADHGICPLPEMAIRTHSDAKRISLGDNVNGLDAALDAAYGLPGGVAGRWVEGPIRDTHPWVYLNRRTIESIGVPYENVESYARNWLEGRANVLAAFSRTQIEKGDFSSDLAKQFGPMVRLAYHPDRCGDLYILTPPYIQVSGALSTGTDHGTPHEYDRHVPILIYGAGVMKRGTREDAVSSLIVAPLIAEALGVPAPAMATEKAPEGVLVAK